MTIDKQKLQKLLWAEAASFRADCADWKRNTEALQEFLGEKTVEEVALELLAENEALRAEASKWKNESVSDSQEIYGLTCSLAQRTGEVRELAVVVDDLAALIKRFVCRLRNAAPGNDLPEQALDYLARKGLQGSPMRSIVEARLP
ncbi:hypothetical protein [Pseudomonas fluorescens]|uniref:Uncharacterized protein n=1 Tax=Pseudomonas fluorescens TaxID=294 RepID=A0A5E6TNH8_PSEFL|nr:hypothetical protein [Pseudomonas fluorescens]VVM94676.1 hypothetical protein PS655_03002 [Pseudomonas fluorescens]